MKKVYRIDEVIAKLETASLTWMLMVPGEGGSEVDDQGRWLLFFLQETRKRSMWRQGMAIEGQGMNEFSAGRTETLTPLPNFFCL